MERFLLLWDEMDEYVGLGRIFIGGACSDVASATTRAADHVKGWTAAASAWMGARHMDQP
jgi:hypothetical protein